MGLFTKLDFFTNEYKLNFSLGQKWSCKSMLTLFVKYNKLYNKKKEKNNIEFP